MSEMNQGEFARTIGVTHRAVAHLRELGMPCRIEGKAVLIPIPDAMKWYVKYKADTAPRKSGSVEEARRRLEGAKAELAELELAEKRGEVLRVADYEKALSDAFARVASRLRGLPHKVATQVTGKTMDERKRQAQRLVDEVYQELHSGTDVPEEVAV